MRRFSLLVLALAVGFVALADNPTTPPPTSDPTSGDTIPITPIPTPIPKPKPLSLNVDIEASYYNDVLTLVFYSDLGNAHIVVTNTTTGESWYDSVNGVGVTSIMLSGDEDCYEIYIYTDRGDYNGEFVI